MNQAPTAPSKRPRNEVEDDEPAQLDPKRRKEGPAVELATKSSYLVIHRVWCAGHSYHSHHQETAYYFDVPRLFARDTKANVLRGAKPIENLDQLLKEQPAYNFVVIKKYECEAYYKDHEGRFEEIGDSRLRNQISSEQRAYLYTLPNDLPLAMPQDESITNFSQDMAEALNALDELCQWNGTFDTDLSEDLELEAPYTMVYHSRILLNDYRERDVNPIYWPRIDDFRNYVMGSMSNDYAEADACFERRETTGRHLTKLFRKGDVLVTRREGYQVGLLCKSVSYPEPRVCELECESWTFDGVFRRRMESLRVVWPSGSSPDAIPIVNLETFPLQFGDDDLRDRLMQRGQMLWDCRFRKYVTYEDSSSAPDMQTTNLRFMVDMSTYNTLHPATDNAPNDPTLTGGDGLDHTAMNAKESPGDDFLLTLPTKVPGFGFHNKRWIDLSVDNIKEVSWDKNAFQKLVMDGTKKNLLEALVVVQGDRSQNKVWDVIEGKSNGLILLLHGPPGTGKTLTAESVAERAQKPLYRVTCGDIGTHPEEMERYLESVLFIGKTWDCVVLLDEADIFLEERSPSDLKRNALVSIFLRVLEYYDGILILTTNRVGTFDEAFKSRIQLAVHYPSLKRLDRAKIWKIILDSVEDKGDVNDDDIFALADYPLNGRQIRNTIKTASQQAFYQKSRLTLGHLQMAIDIANEFEDYIRRARGQTDEERAEDIMARAPERRE
ncbi:P-loop containing nucleoside triphosphate hydrolase protein, partial [Aureobasidium melanogenum]